MDNKFAAIPKGYKRIGEVAKNAGISTNTLRYYDKEGLLSPSAETEGRYRLYTDKDVAKLMQILLMKRLGFSLSEIKSRLVSMDTTADVVEVLTVHAANISQKIAQLSETLAAIEALQAEIKQLDAVDFNKFADILSNLELNNERYWVVKYIDDDVLDVIKNNISDEEAAVYIDASNQVMNDAAKYQERGLLPGGKEGQELAARYWQLMMKLTGGDLDVASKMNAQAKQIINDDKFDDDMLRGGMFIAAALEIYSNSNEGGKND